MRFWRSNKHKNKIELHRTKLTRQEIESELEHRAKNYVFADTTDEQSRITRKAYQFIYESVGADIEMVRKYVLRYHFLINQEKDRLSQFTNSYNERWMKVK